jgi:pimeloyl-ACP methyl ester carboxylesterase
MPYIKTSDNVEIFYQKSGKGKPIIFVHEFAGDHRSWEPQINFFSRYYNCITYSARGYPPSQVPESIEKYSQERAWRDILDVIDKLNIEKAHIIGLSMGGFATLHFGINCPNRALSLTIAGCGYGAKADIKNKNEGFTEESEKNAKDILDNGIEKFGNDYGLGSSRVQFQNKDYNSWKIFNERLINHSQVGSANTLLGVQSKRPNLYELKEKIKKIKVPTLIINGDEDDMCLEVGIYLKRNISSSGLVVVPKTGHTINLEEPALFNQYISNFFQAIENNSWGLRDNRAKIITN